MDATVRHEIGSLTQLESTQKYARKTSDRGQTFFITKPN